MALVGALLVWPAACAPHRVPTDTPSPSSTATPLPSISPSATDTATLAYATATPRPPTATPTVRPTATSPTTPTTLVPGGTWLPKLNRQTLVPVYTYRIVGTYPHDAAAYTQGLVYVEGTLYESTGLYGESSLREVELQTGQVLRSVALGDDLFGEGIAVYEETIVQLTWREHVGLVYDRKTFELEGEFRYPTEGWGLAYNGEFLILSDGTALMRCLDPRTYEVLGQVEVHDGPTPVPLLNELEYVRGEVLANVYMTDLIARIDPATGQVTGWIDLTGLLGDAYPDAEVLNGIAYDGERDRLFVTGKRWPRLFEIELVPTNDGGNAG